LGGEASVTDGHTSQHGIAPAADTALAHRDQLREHATLSIQVDSEAGALPVLLVVSGGTVRAFINICPHQDLPLDYRGANVISADGTMLRCSNHDAAFSIEDGSGVQGLGVGRKLGVIPIEIGADGFIRVQRCAENIE
jgi:nitrite reductase/ring-hydroxylating ferredoxin subunit